MSKSLSKLVPPPPAVIPRCLRDTLEDDEEEEEERGGAGEEEREEEGERVRRRRRGRRRRSRRSSHAACAIRWSSVPARTPRANWRNKTSESFFIEPRADAKLTRKSWRGIWLCTMMVITRVVT